VENPLSWQPWFLRLTSKGKPKFNFDRAAQIRV